MQETQENTVNHESHEDYEDVGMPLISWEMWERQPHERSRNWYIIASIIGAALLVYSVVTANYLFALIILITGVILLINGAVKPNRINVHITDMGIVVGETFHDYKKIKDFALIYEPPVKRLYIDFNSVVHPMVSIPIEDTDPTAIRETLLPYVYENLDREDETLTDTLKRVYKL